MLTEGTEKGCVLLKDRSMMNIDGVSDVISFDELAVLLRTAQGQMTVEGEGLHITRLDLEKEIVCLEGKINALYYTGEGGSAGKRGGFLSRLIK